jgi:hypothetical protein
VNGRDTTPAHIDARMTTRNLRHVSGGFWNVGGTASLQTGQLQGIPTGNGHTFASGTTAPMHTATFLDQATGDDKAAAHEMRLALALDIDQASRILLHSTEPQASDNIMNSEKSPFVWQDSIWKRQLAHAGKWNAVAPAISTNTDFRFREVAERTSPGAKSCAEFTFPCP